jgi:hypothetical protein
MAHGTPLGTADNDERYGAQGAFLIEAGISSSYHIANFFGLTERLKQPEAAAAAKPNEASKPVGAAAPVPPTAQPATVPDLSKVLWPLTTLKPAVEPPRKPAEPQRKPRRRAIDVGAVITRALTAAGLMKQD